MTHLLVMGRIKKLSNSWEVLGIEPYYHSTYMGALSIIPNTDTKEILRRYQKEWPTVTEFKLVTTIVIDECSIKEEK